MKTCSICNQPYTEYGNNAQPVNDGRCCDYCDCYVVIPTRIANITGKPMKDFQKLSLSMLSLRINPPQIGETTNEL